MIVRKLVLLFCLFYSVLLSAQITAPSNSITEGEYFWDTDPGEGNGTPLVAFDGNWDESMESVSESISSLLFNGYHTFNIRVKDADGVWSSIFSSVIYFDQLTSLSASDFDLTQGEYFWDADPGEGNGTPLVAFDGSWDESMESASESISSLLFNGYHTFNIRVKDADGVWGYPFIASIFFNDPSIIYGCTDSTALNYDPLATLDDGSCSYPCLPDTSYANITACDSVVWNGITYDSSGTYAYNGSSTINNSSASLDGINDYINVGNNSVLNIDNSVTIEAWINAANLSNRNAIYSTRKNNDPGSFQLEIGSESNVGTSFVAVTGPGTWIAITGSNVINNNSGWVHIAYTRDGVGDNHEIYINGVPQAINTNPYTFANNNALKEIGRGTSQLQNYEGKIDQVSIWNIALSQQEIQNYMNCSPQGNEVGLVGYWNFEEGSGNTAYDQTSNGNDGIINGATYDTNVPAQSCSLTNANGCDSIAILNLTINQSNTSYTNITNCDSYTWSVNGTTYTQTGTYTDVSTNSSGCTDTETLVLTINNSTTNTNYLPSNGLVGWWPFNGNANDESGNAYNGTVNGAALTTDRLGATNSAYSFNGNSAFIQTPTSAVNFPSGFTISVWAKVLGANTNTNCSFGCAEFLVTKGDDGQSGRISIQYSQDTGGETFAGVTDYSLAVNSLTQYPFPQPNWHHVVYTFDNTNYKIYLDGLLMNTIASTTAIPNLASDIVFGKMPNNTSYPYYFNGYLDDIGIWNHALTPGEITNLYSAVNFASPTGTDTRTECDAYTWIDGNTYTTSNNTATFTIFGGASSGCDSIVNLDLTILNSSAGTDTRTECSSYTWIDGNTYTANNNSTTFNITSGAANGCDSLVTLDLTIVNSTSGTDTKIECNSYTWIDGNTYTASNNSATFNITNGAANGCDSLVTLDLTILNATSGTDTRTECNSYTWIDGINYTASNNSATFNIVGGVANGCDSLVTLDLTIVNSTSGTDTRTECNSYTWIDGINYTASNNSATFNIVGGAANGCDSLVTLDLTINNVTDITTSSSGAIITANNLGATYQWLDCDSSNVTIPGETGQSYTVVANGNYAVELTENGCIDTSACVNIITTAILENNFGSEFNIYPNPTKGNFSVDLDKTYNSILITITDLSGRLIESTEYNETKLMKLKIDKSAGIYLLKIETGDQKAVIRFVKE